MEYDVYMRAQEWTSVGRYVRNYPLAVYCSEYDLFFGGTDLPTLEAELRKALENRISFSWEPWLEISVSEFKSDDGSTNDRMLLEIEVRSFELATRNGKTYSRQPGAAQISERVPEGHARELVSHHRGMVDGGEYGTSALVRDTPEVRAILKRLRQGMDHLTSELLYLFAPNNILDTIKALQQGGGMPLLTAGAPKATTARKTKR